MAKSTPLALDQGYQPTDLNNSPIASPLETAVQAYLLNNNANNPQQDTSGNASGVQTAQIGPYGSHILVKNPNNGWAGQADNFLAGAGKAYLDNQTLQKRGQFIQGVHQIMSSPNQTQQDRMNALMDLQAQHGTDYGIGINDIATKLGLTKGQNQDTLTPAQRIQSLMTGLQSGQLDPDQAHQQALKVDPNYQQTQPALAGALNQSYTQKLDGLVKQQMGPEYEANPDFIATGKGSPVHVATVGISNNPAINSLSPQDAQAAVAKSNPAYAKYLGMLADGQIQMGGRSTKQQQQLLQDVATLYPGVDMAQIQARYKTRQDFTSGKTSQQIQSLNTAMGHLDTLNNIASKLTSNKGMPITNAMVQGVEGATGTGDAATLQQFNFTKTALAHELDTLFKGQSGTDMGTKALMDRLKSSDNPQMLQGVIKDAVEMMNSRLSAINDKWSNSYNMPTDKQFPVLSAKSQEIVNRLGGEGQGSSFQEGKTYKDANGNMATYTNGQFVPVNSGN